MSEHDEDGIPDIPEAELDMAMEELHGPNTSLPAEERIAKLNRRVTYIKQALAQALELASLDEASERELAVIDVHRRELAEAQRQLAALSQRN